MKEHNIENDTVDISCRALSPEEAIGNTERRDFPIITGKDIMIQAEYRGSRGQAFTDAPAVCSVSLSEILETDVANDDHARGIFVAAVNAVMQSLGLCRDTVHCRTEGPEKCAQDMLSFLQLGYPDSKNIALVGYQPALLEMLAKSGYTVRVFDLNEDNINQVRYGIKVEDGAAATGRTLEPWADLILCTGSALCNGTIVDYLELDTEVLFFGITVAGAAELLGLKRACFADKYEMDPAGN
ncbi:MAG: Rossmann-like domain-containing protein [Oscillospiraceae bacterium]